MDSILQARLQRPRPFKAAGGKTWLVQSRISDVWKNTTNEHRRLFDPFVGGGALPLLVQPSNCLVADARLLRAAAGAIAAIARLPGRS